MPHGSINQVQKDDVDGHARRKTPYASNPPNLQEFNYFLNTQVAESIIEEFSDGSTFEQLLELEFGIIESQLSKLQDDGFVSMDIICEEFKDEWILWRVFYGLNKTVGSGKKV